MKYNYNMNILSNNISLPSREREILLRISYDIGVVRRTTPIIHRLNYKTPSMVSYNFIT